MGLSPLEIALVLLVAVLMFGPRRIAGIGRGLGEGIRNFRHGLSGADDDEPADPPAAKPTGAAAGGPRQVTDARAVPQRTPPNERAKTP
jgi:sec-independent protein translocase protein TatA